MSEASASFHPRNKFIRNLIARPRLLFCALIVVFIAWIEPEQWQSSTRILIAWNIGTWIYLASTALIMMRANSATIRRQAIMADESRFMVLTLAILAASASLIAIIFQLQVKDVHGLLRNFHLVLAASTIVSAWSFIQVTFAQHYAHEYFVERQHELELPEELRGGLVFPGTDKPEFGDFLYFAMVIGVACATADVNITTKAMRRVATVHCVLAFFFNTTVLALTINIGAGLI
jgi:uncharacterized membrane protein